MRFPTGFRRARLFGSRTLGYTTLICPRIEAGVVVAVSAYPGSARFFFTQVVA